MKKLRTPLLAVLLPLAGIPLLVALSRTAPSEEMGPAAAPKIPLKCEMIPNLVRGFFKNHVQYRMLSASLRDSAADFYVKRLDPSKIYLLDSDAVDSRKSLAQVFEASRKGDCAALDAVHAITLKRNREAEAFVRQTLAGQYKLDESVELVLDPEKRSHPRTEAERDAELLRQIHFQMSNYLDGGTTLEESKRLLIHRYELRNKRLAEQSQTDLITEFLDSFATALDPHSSYLSADTLEDFQIQMGLSLEGIGVSLSTKDGFTIVEKVIPGGAADRAKLLREKDKLIGVMQESGGMVDIIDMDLREVVKLIRGRKGSRVTLKVLREDGDRTNRFEATIVRDKIDLEEQAAKLRIENVKQGERELKIGIVDLPSFYGDKDRNQRSSYSDMKALLEQARTKGVDGVVLDLSKNGGGLLEESVLISGLFIRDGGIVATKIPDRELDVMKDIDEAVSYSGPLVVLTSRVSASASEILAGALKDYRRAVIVGADHTYGKGSIQSVVGLPPGLGALKVTTGMFFRPGGLSTQRLGINADVVLPSIYDGDDFGEKSLDNALKAKSVSPFIAESANGPEPAQRWEPVPPNLIRRLARLSKERIAKDKDFAKIEERLKEIRDRKESITLAELRKQDKKAGRKGEEAEEPEEKDNDKPSAQLREAMNVLADYIVLKGGGDASAQTALVPPGGAAADSARP